MKKIRDIFQIKLIATLVVVASVLTLYIMSTVLQNNYLGLSVYFVGMIATVVCLLLAVRLSMLITHNRPSAPPKAIRALLFALRKDSDARVRREAAKELGQLNVEQSALHKMHSELDNALVASLENDSDARVREAAAEGLGELEKERSSYHHKHHTLDDFILRPRV